MSKNEFQNCYFIKTLNKSLQFSINDSPNTLYLVFREKMINFEDERRTRIGSLKKKVINLRILSRKKIAEEKE